MIGLLRATVPTLTRRSTPVDWLGSVGRGALTASGELMRASLACRAENAPVHKIFKIVAWQLCRRLRLRGLYVRMSRDARRRKAAIALRGRDWPDASAAGSRNRGKERRDKRPGADRRAAPRRSALAADCCDYQNGGGRKRASGHARHHALSRRPLDRGAAAGGPLE